MNSQKLLDEIFDVVRQLIRTNSKLYNSLNDDYKSGIKFYIDMIPQKYIGYIFDAYEIGKEYLTCVDIHKFLEITSKHKAKSFNIKTEELIGGFVIDNFNDPQIKRFVSEIIHKLNRIFICLDYAVSHPKEILKNASVFDTVEDIF